MPKQYPNNPGFSMLMQDNQLTIVDTEPTTGNITVIDVGLWGPVNYPVNFSSPDMASPMFGKVTGEYGNPLLRPKGYNGNALMRGMLEAYQCGCRNITLVRGDFGGKRAITTLLKASAVASKAQSTNTAESSAGDDGYSTLTVTFAAEVWDGEAGASAAVVGNAAWTSTKTDGSVWEITAKSTTNRTWSLRRVAPADGLLGEDEGGNWTCGEGLSIMGRFPGELGNTVGFKNDYTAATTTAEFYLRLPQEFGGFTYKFSSDEYETLRDLLYRVNNDPEIRNVVEMSLAYGTDIDTALSDFFTQDIINDTVGSGGYFDIGDALRLVNDSIAYPSFYQNGTDWGLDANGDEMNPASDTATAAQKRAWFLQALGNPCNPADEMKMLQLIRGTEIGWIVIPSLHIDELITPSTGAVVGGEANVLQYLLDFAHQQQTDGIVTRVAIDYTPLADTSLEGVHARVAQLKVNDFLARVNYDIYNRDGESEIFDIGAYLCVVGGPQGRVSLREIGSYPVGGAIQFAALKTTLHPSSPATLKVVPGFIGLDYEFKKKQLSDLAGGQGPRKDGGAYIVFDVTSTGRPIVNNSLTAARKASDFHDEHNLTVMEACKAVIRYEGSRFLGKPFGLAERMAMDTAIERGLDKLAESRVIYGKRKDGYEFVITQTARNAGLNSADIDFSVRPNFVLKVINTNMRLRAS